MVAITGKIGKATRFDVRCYYKTGGRERGPIAMTVYRLSALRHSLCFTMYRAVHPNLNNTLFKSLNRMDAVAIWVQTAGQHR